MRPGPKGKRKATSPAEGPQNPRKVEKRRRVSPPRAAAVGDAPASTQNLANPLRRSARLKQTTSTLSSSQAPVVPPSSRPKAKPRSKKPGTQKEGPRARVGQAVSGAKTKQPKQLKTDTSSTAEQFEKDTKKRRGDARQKREQQAEGDPLLGSGGGKKRRLPQSPEAEDSRTPIPPPSRPKFSRAAPEAGQLVSTPSPQGDSAFPTSIFGNWSYSLEISIPPSKKSTVNEAIKPAPVVELKIWDPSGETDDRMGGALAHVSIIASLYDETGTNMLRSPGGSISGNYMQTPQEETPLTEEDDDHLATPKKTASSSGTGKARAFRSPTPERREERSDGGLVAFATFSNLRITKAGKFKLKFSAMATEVGNNSPSGQSQASTEISEQQLGGSRCKAQVLSEVFSVS